MAEETRSVMLTRQTSPVAAMELRKHLWSDAPEPSDRDVIRLRDGHVLLSVARPVEALTSTIAAEALDEHVVVEPDRRLFRISPMFVEAPPVQRTKTWNLKAIGIAGSKQATGKGASVAVLDSGLDFDHPDFPRVESVKLVADESAVDEN
ncbi:MAG TPA: hypothetical protein VHK90_15655, partial [Thermoanaerobaculia bacterium]|nr:hypothetical protein [Thermoanaerobaculia bacterium]